MENTKLEKIGVKPIDDNIEGQIVLNVGKTTFALYHSDNYDVFAVYLILIAALKHVQELAEKEAENEGRYLQ